MVKILIALLGITIISAYAEPTREAVNLATSILSRRVIDPNQIVECTDDPGYSRITQVLSEPVTQRAGRCPQAVGPGQYRLMRRHDGYLSGNYLFKNLGNNRYRAVMNIDFQSSTPGLAESMRSRATKCMHQMAPYLLGPGKELDIQILSPSEVRQLPRDQRPDKYTVNVTRERFNYRGNANNYGSNFQCAAIGHEILHFLGLCDEYHEGIKDDTPAATASNPNPTKRYIDWRCRAVTSEPSYMRNMIYAFQSTVPQTSRCECNEECQRIMNHSPEAKRLYLGMNGEDYMNTEMSVMDNHIIGFDANRNPIRRQICHFVSTPGLQRGTLPAKPFELKSENGNHFVFRSYEPHYIIGPPGSPPSASDIWVGVQTYDCTCPEGESNSYCRRIMEQMKQRANEYHPRVVCPQGTRPLDYGPSIGHQNVPGQLDCENGTCALVMTSPGSNRPLLLPQQFARIAAGNCRGGASSAYETCEVFATRARNPSNTNRAMSLPENPSVNQCSDLPPQCNDDRFYLHGITSPVSPQ